jgi:deazaflavin-dependent oxidoreductase (nitroreductase family)
VPASRVRRAYDAVVSARPVTWIGIRLAPKVDPWMLRRTDGRISVSFGRRPVLLLQHLGARSGRRRETPLLYVTDGDRLVVIASAGGSAHHPAWLHNLRAHPRCSVTARDGRSGDYTAREASGDERERLWALAADFYGGYDAYRQRAGSREIPVVVLEPTHSGPSAAGG